MIPQLIYGQLQSSESFDAIDLLCFNGVNPEFDFIGFVFTLISARISFLFFINEGAQIKEA